MKKWMLVILLHVDDEYSFDTVEYRFNTYTECMDARIELNELLSEDPDVYNYKLTIVNL